MENDFQEYIASLNPPISQANQDILKKIELNTRTLKLPTADIVQELIENGMNRLTALDIVTAAQSYFREQEKRLQYPLGIFWDVENIRIPTKISGEEASEKIKQATKVFGNPVVCNAYFESSDLSTMKPEKRQKLQQCGWNLMDVPHLTKKEVADKVIIVDILLFILDHSDGECTVCLISDDTDFSYLLAKLKSYPKVKTMVISKDGELLKLNANVSMRWGIDILKLPYLYKDRDEDVVTTAAVTCGVTGVASAAAAGVSGGVGGGVPEGAPIATAVTADVAMTGKRPLVEEFITSMVSETSRAEGVGSDGSPKQAKTRSVQYSSSWCSNPNMTMNTSYTDDDTWTCSEAEFNEYDRLQLIKVLRDLTIRENKREHLKSLVGILLKNSNPQAYGDKIVRNDIFDRAKKDGVVIERGTLGSVTLELAKNYM